MTYCFNPNCSQPKNPNNVQTCQSCGTSLWLENRYKALELLGKSRRERTFYVLDSSQELPSYRILKQFLALEPEKFKALVTSLEKISHHPLIPNLIDTFKSGNYYYLIQEYQAGINLYKKVTEIGVLKIEQVWQLLADILPVLQFIHQQDIVHRNIKPANIIESISLSEKNKIHYLLVDWSSLGKNSDREIVGDAEYTAPWQLEGKTLPASDLYSLGLTCLYLLTGISPFNLVDEVNQTSIWRSYWQVDKEDITNQGLAERLGQILDKLVSLNQKELYLSAQEVLQMMGRNSSFFPTPKKTAFSWSCEDILPSHVNAIAWSSDGSTIASGSDNCTINFWSFKSNSSPSLIPVAVLTGHSQAVKTVAFSPLKENQEILASGGADGIIYLWDRQQTQQQIKILQGHSQAVNSLIFNPTGDLLISASTDKTIHIWDYKTDEIKLIKTLTGHNLGVTALAISPQGNLLASASQDRTIKLWDIHSNKPPLTLNGHTWAVRALAWSPDGAYLASGGDDNTLRLWDVASGKCIQILSGHSWVISALEFIDTKDHGLILVSASWDKTVKLWQLKEGQNLAILTGHTDSINAIAIYPLAGAWYLASSSKDKTIRIWRITPFIN